MGKDARGDRDGTGPYKDSYQNQQMPGIGRREAGGEPCPEKPPPPDEKPPPAPPAK